MERHKLLLYQCHSPCNLVDKRNLWPDLVNLKHKFDPGEWVGGGGISMQSKMYLKKLGGMYIGRVGRWRRLVTL